MKKNIIKSFKFNKKYIFIVMVLIFSVFLLSFTTSVTSTISPKAKYTVVIDAGHGGFDVK